MADADDETHEKPTRKKAKLEEENVETNIEHVMADIQASDTGQNQELAIFSSLNDVQGATPKPPGNTETINDFIPAKYLKTPSLPGLKAVTASLVRNDPVLFKTYQAIITCDLKKVLDKGIYERSEPDHTLTTIDTNSARAWKTTKDSSMEFTSFLVASTAAAPPAPAMAEPSVTIQI